MSEKTEKTLRIAVICVCSLIFAFSVYQIVARLIEMAEAKKTAKEVAESFVEVNTSFAEEEISEEESSRESIEDSASESIEESLPESEPESEQESSRRMPTNIPIWPDFEALKAENSDTIGWIYCSDISGAKINYPIVQGTDNDFYLYHNFKKIYEFSGSIFMDYRFSGEWKDNNTVLYGHAIRGSDIMFTTLQLYKHQYYYDAFPTMWVYTDGIVYRAYVYSAYVTANAGDGAYKSFKDDTEGYQAWLKEIKAKSLVNTMVDTSQVKKTCTLCTCTNGAETEGNRMIVVLSLVSWPVYW